MPFTGDLEHLPIADIIQLIQTTRKSGLFSVKGAKGESSLVFSSGYIVGATYLNDSIRIESVLVKMGAVTLGDLQKASRSLKTAPDQQQLIAGLLHTGVLKLDDAQRGLKKLVEITIIELMSWTKGTFLFDTDALTATSGESEQEVVVEAQMALMDALRLFDERERDRAQGKDVPSFETLYADVLPGEGAAKTRGGHAAITADVLGLADLDRLEKRIPRPASEMELFDPVAIHRQSIKELLVGFSPDEQEAFVSFLGKAVNHKVLPETAAEQAGKAVILFSGDMLLSHAIRTLCNEEGIPVFGVDAETDLERTLSQCLSSLRTPVIVLDSPAKSGPGFPLDRVISLRNGIRKKFPAIPLLQLASARENDFILRSYQEGVRAVLPKPEKEIKRDTYVRDTIQFLIACTAYIKAVQTRPDAATRAVKELNKEIKSLREAVTPSDAALVMLAAVAGMFERAITFIVRASELIGERAIGVTSEKSMGPVPANALKIPLAKPSVFRAARDKGLIYYGEDSDEALTELFRVIGKPASPAVALVPVVCERQVVAIVYGDFGKKEASPVQLDILEILAQQVGVVLEYALFKRQAAKAAQKT